jgi:hypothetical protein
MKHQTSTAFNISRKLATAALVFTGLGWAYWGLVWLFTPEKWGPFWTLLVVAVPFVLPVVACRAPWSNRGFWVRPLVAVVAAIYFLVCYVTSFVAIGFVFLPGAALLGLASSVRLFAHVPPSSESNQKSRGSEVIHAKSHFFEF